MSAPRKVVTTIGEFTQWVEEVGYYFTHKPGEGKEMEYLARGSEARGRRVIISSPDFLSKATRAVRRMPTTNCCTGVHAKGSALIAERPPRNAWEWYSVLQHYRAPTRLLDWSDSAFVALLRDHLVDPAKGGRKAWNVPVVWTFESMHAKPVCEAAVGNCGVGLGRG